MSLSANGQLSPIKVRPSTKRPGRYEAVYGHRRLLATKYLRKNSIIAEICDVTDEQMITLALAENLDRDNFTDYEQGLLFRKLHEMFGRSITDIAMSVGKSIAYVSQHITMTKVFDSPEIDEEKSIAILEKLTERQCRILARLEDPRDRLRFATIALTEKLGMKELDKIIGHPWGPQRRETQLKGGNRVSRIQREESTIAEIVQKTIEGVNNRDISVQCSFRYHKWFSLFDDFPPLSLMNYDTAVEHNFSVVKRSNGMKLSYSDLNIHRFGDFAYATFLVEYEIPHENNESKIKSRVTFVFAKLGSGWHIIHEHWSPSDSAISVNNAPLL